MSLLEFGRLIFYNLKGIVLIPLTLALAVILFTQNMPREYGSSAVLYTGIASGYNIESQSGDKLDYHSVNNAFDNLISIIKSRQTLEEVGLHLLTHDLLKIDSATTPDSRFGQLKDYLNDAYDYFEADSFQEMYRLVRGAYDRRNSKVIDLIRVDQGYYSIKSINSLQAKRHKSSDMLILYYTSDDPTVSKATLDMVIKVFTERYAEMKEAETGSVVSYFQKELDRAKYNLDAAEDTLSIFRSTEKVINYEEQTKAIAIKKQNALEEFTMRQMNLKATQAALTNLEEKLTVRESLLSKNADLLTKRNRLTTLTEQLVHSQSNEGQINRVQIEQEVEELKSEIEASLHQVFNLSNSKEGLPSTQLLNEWLNNVVALDREKANVAFYQKRLTELDGLYNQFAPLGSTLARLERDISVLERAYLGILNSLNEAKLKQQNIRMMSKLEVIDQPVLPKDPLASKRALMVIATFLFGLFSILGFIITREFLDMSLSSPEKAEKLSRHQVYGAFPVITDDLRKNGGNQLLNKLSGLIINRLNINKLDNKAVITITSAFEREGKTIVIKQLKKEFQSRGISVRSFDLKRTKSGQLSKSSQEFTDNLESDNFIGVTLLEVPALSKGEELLPIVIGADLDLLICKASNKWNRAHAQMMTVWYELTERKPSLVLNGVQLYYLDQLIGQSPVKRNGLMVGLRRILQFEFSKSFFNSFLS